MVQAGRLVLGRRPPGAVLPSSREPGELSQWLSHDDSTMNIVRPPGAVLPSSREPSELSQWLSHDDSTMNIVLSIIITILMT